jgi:hypothetical protein
VKQTAGQIEFYSFKVWDNMRGGMVKPRAKSTAQRIARIGGEIVPGTSEWVAPEALDQEGRVKEINPGLQTHVFNQPRNT